MNDPHPRTLRFSLDATPICRSCGAAGYSGERYCPLCGTMFPTKRSGYNRECAWCGEPIRHPVAYFCPRCGRKHRSGEWGVGNGE